MNISVVVLVVIIVCWFAFFAVFIIRKQPSKSPDSKRDSASIYGLVVQGLSYAIVWAGHRELLTPFLPLSRNLSLIFDVIAATLAIASVAMVYSAVKTLGRGWSLTARVVEGHELATTGTYRFVRHPIYTAMLGMLLATGLAVSHWLALFLGLIVFVIGTTIRVTREERLLRETFGSNFDNYTRRVSAIVPGIW